MNPMLKNHYGNSSVPTENKLNDSTIISMALTDMPAILAIESIAHTHPWSEKLFISNFGKRYVNHVLMLEEHIVGYFVASYVAGEMTLLNIAVHPAYQGKGFGRALLLFLQQLSLELAQQEIWLEVRASNAAAIALYQQLHFAEVDRRRDYYPTENGREDAIVMCCHL